MRFDGKKHLLPFGFWLFFSFLQKFFGYLVKSKQTLQFDGKIQLFSRENEIFDDFQPLCKMAILSHPLIYTK